jgi:hypothetical protein
LPVTEAATGLDAALRATQAHRLHLAPLDLAQDLPPLEFGSGKVCRFTADELRELVDERRLKRAHQRQDFDADRFAEFHWLVVEEAVTLDREPEARAVPVLFMNLNKDLGEIEPHKGRFPLAFEAALFFLLLAPWETWSTMVEVDWRGFRVPWVYTADSDIFVRANALPSVDTLSWEHRILRRRLWRDGRGRESCRASSSGCRRDRSGDARLRSALRLPQRSVPQGQCPELARVDLRGWAAAGRGRAADTLSTMFCSTASSLFEMSRVICSWTAASCAAISSTRCRTSARPDDIVLSSSWPDDGVAGVSAPTDAGEGANQLSHGDKLAIIPLGASL